MTLDTTYAGRRVLVTGHTGFKGSWLCLWLARMGAQVTGYSLEPPTEPSHFALVRPEMRSVIADVRDHERLTAVVAEARPEIAFHLAAQPLVRRSYREAVQTLETNVLGTANFLDACRAAEGVRAAVVVTSDKCYENREWVHGYRETDRLGGFDPYSCSKACAELVTASFRNSFFADGQTLVASVRAGNVLGGGDWSEDRLVPDMMRAAAAGGTTLIRNPGAVRPWQHVLDVLAGYLLLGRRLLEGQRDFAGPWNFGPGPESFLTAGEVARAVAARWDAVAVDLAATPPAGPHEAGLLALDSGKARRVLGWRPLLGIEQALDLTVQWYREHHEQGHIATAAQIDDYARRSQAGA